VPPLPVAHGVVNFGDGPLVILSEKQGGSHRGYAVGEKVGEFTLLAVNKNEIVLEFDGQRLSKKIEELMDRSEGQSGSPAPAAVTSSTVTTTRVEAVQASAQPKVESTANASGPGTVISGQIRACQPGEASPPGTVMNGLRKVVSETPFGKVCRWEPVQ
jgi:hypothetical protein